VERESAFFKLSPEDEYHLPQIDSENRFLGIAVIDLWVFRNFHYKKFIPVLALSSFPYYFLHEKNSRKKNLGTEKIIIIQICMGY
jgi:hypothetical protein